MDFFFCVKSSSSFVADCFFPTTKHPNVTRLAFDRAQVNIKIIWVRFYATILTIRRYTCSLKLWNKVPNIKFQTSLRQK